MSDIRPGDIVLVRGVVESASKDPEGRRTYSIQVQSFPGACGAFVWVNAEAIVAEELAE